MRRRSGKPRRKAGPALAAAAFLGAVMCLSCFSVRVMLFVIAALLIILGIFLLKT